MKRNKVISFVLSAAISLSFGTGSLVYAVDAENSATINDAITNADILYAENNLFPALEANLILAPESLDFNANDVNNLSVGDSFTMANLSESGIQEVDDIMYFPILSNDDIIAILTLMKDNGELSASIGKDFSNELSKYLDDTKGDVALFAYNEGIFGIDENSDISEIFVLPQEDINNIGTVTSGLDYIDVAFEENVLSEELLCENTTAVDNSAIMALTSEYSYHNINSINATNSWNYLLNYPIVFQGNLGICWAATVAAMVIYEVDSINNLTATEVCDAINHSYTGGSAYDIITALNHYLPSIYAPTFYSRVMTQSEVKTIIDNDDPACMLCHDVNNSNNGHAVSLCGYSESGSIFQIRIMDSAYQCFKFSTYSSTNGFHFDFGNTQYKWDYTVRLLYNL